MAWMGTLDNVEEDKKTKDSKEISWYKKSVFQSIRFGICGVTDILWPQHYSLNPSGHDYADRLSRLVNCRRGCDSILLGIGRPYVRD